MRTTPTLRQPLRPRKSLAGRPLNTVRTTLPVIFAKSIDLQVISSASLECVSFFPATPRDFCDLQAEGIAAHPILHLKLDAVRPSKNFRGAATNLRARKG